MIKVSQVVVVEGKYDKIKLSSIIDATIIETGGFSIFKDKEKTELLKVLCKECGLVIITDSDSAGFKIRNYLKNIISDGEIINVYIPEILGKEKRKSTRSKEGFLGVEGVSAKIITDALKCAGVTESKTEHTEKISKYDLYECGLCGKADSKQKRNKFLLSLNLPTHLSTNSMLDVLNTIMDKKEFTDKIKEI